MTLRFKTIHIMTLSIMTLRLKGYFATLSIIDTQHNSNLPFCWLSLRRVLHFIYCYTECHYAVCRNVKCCYTVCHYSEFQILFIVTPNVIMLSVVMLNVIILSVIMLAKFCKKFCECHIRVNIYISSYNHFDTGGSLSFKRLQRYSLLFVVKQQKIV
jgi:hypothetical protein